MEKVTVREIIEMLAKCNWDDEITCIAEHIDKKIKEGKTVYDEDLGPEVNEYEINDYKYKIVGVSQFVGVSGRGVQIIVDLES